MGSNRKQARNTIKQINLIRSNNFKPSNTAVITYTNCCIAFLYNEIHKQNKLDIPFCMH